MMYILTEEEYNALKGGKKFKEVPYTPEEEEKYIPSGMKNEIAMMKTSCKLTDEEVVDIKSQIIDMGKRGFIHYIVHTNDRGEPSKFYPDTGDRYWECGYLYRAKTQAVITGFGGFQKKRFADRGMLPLLFETRVAEQEAGLPSGEIPKKMAERLGQISVAFGSELTQSDIEDLQYQIKMMNGKGIDHFIIHTFGRNYFPDEKVSGDRYWECEGGDIIIDSIFGKLRKDFIDEGVAELFYENLI